MSTPETPAPLSFDNPRVQAAIAEYDVGAEFLAGALVECLRAEHEARVRAEQRIAELESLELDLRRSRSNLAGKVHEHMEFVSDLTSKLQQAEAERDDLKNAGGPPFIRSEAIRNLKNDLDAAKSKLAKLEEEYPWRLTQDYGIIELLEKELKESKEQAEAERDRYRTVLEAVETISPRIVSKIPEYNYEMELVKAALGPKEDLK